MLLARVSEKMKNNIQHKITQRERELLYLVTKVYTVLLRVVFAYSTVCQTCVFHLMEF